MAAKTHSIPIQRLQRVDRTLGRLVCSALQPWRALRRLRRHEREHAAPKRVLLIKFWGLGSLQLLTPAVATLRRRHRGAELVLLTLRENEAFVRGLDVFDDVLSLDVRVGSWTAMARRVLGLVRDLRAGSFDRVYDFEFFTSFSAVVSFLTSAPRTFGFSSTSVWRGDLHTDGVTFNRYWHVARNFRALAGGEAGEAVGLDEVSAFPVQDGDRAGVGRKLDAAGVPDGASYVVLNPNAGRLSLERRWPPAHFAALAQRTLAATDRHLVLIGSPAEREYTAGVRAAVTGDDGGRLVDLAGELSLGELCALLEGAEAVVTNDSGPMHLAAALGAPTLGLFGPETPLMYEPLGPHAEALYRPTVCSPCINVHQGKIATCIHSRPECLVNISVDEVWSWVERQVAGARAPLRLAPPATRAQDA